MSAATDVLLPAPEDLESIVADLVFTLDELPESGSAAPTGAARKIRGRVAVLGEQSCLVEVKVDLDGALLLAQAMFDLAPEATSESDVCDAVGELANIVAGSTKSLADADLRLGLPTTDVVASGTPTPHSLLSTAHRWRGHDLLVTINPIGEQP